MWNALPSTKLTHLSVVCRQKSLLLMTSSYSNPIRSIAFELINMRICIVDNLVFKMPRDRYWVSNFRPHEKKEKKIWEEFCWQKIRNFLWFTSKNWCSFNPHRLRITGSYSTLCLCNFVDNIWNLTVWAKSLLLKHREYCIISFSAAGHGRLIFTLYTR